MTKRKLRLTIVNEKQQTSAYEAGDTFGLTIQSLEISREINDLRRRGVINSQTEAEYLQQEGLEPILDTTISRNSRKKETA